MRLQIIDVANFKVAEQFTDPTDGSLETTGTKVLRIFEIDWDTPALKVYEWDTGNEAFTASSPTDDEGNLTHYQAGGINTGVWISPAIVYTTFTAGKDYIFQFSNEDDTVFQSYEVKYQGAGIWANISQVSGDTTAADNLEADYDGTGFAKSNSTIGTCTANTDMRGTDSAALASVCTEGRLAELDAANLPSDVDTALAGIAATLVDTDELQGDWADGGRLDLLVDAIKAITDLLPSGGALTDLAVNVTKLNGSAAVDTYSLIEAARLLLAEACGKVSGASTNAPVFRAADDSKDRITATVDADGNRSAVTLVAT